MQRDVAELKEKFEKTIATHEQAIKKALDSIGIVNNEVNEIRRVYSKLYYYIVDTSLAISTIMSEIDRYGNFFCVE